MGSADIKREGENLLREPVKHVNNVSKLLKTLKTNTEEVLYGCLLVYCIQFPYV